jgi:acetylornithine deacetylase/succinyl-diaminopimelate desuccinylase-like protein
MALQYAADHYDEFLASLRDLLTIPSISTDESRKPDIARAAEFLAERLRSLGMENVKIYPTSYHPVVYGEWLGAGADAPTVLMYGHYDVQPPDPLDLWESPPFEPTQRGESLYARGASDMKGQVFATLSAVESIVRTGTFPVNIKWIFEGEEEIGGGEGGSSFIGRGRLPLLSRQSSGSYFSKSTTPMKGSPR